MECNLLNQPKLKLHFFVAFFVRNKKIFLTSSEDASSLLFFLVATFLSKQVLEIERKKKTVAWLLLLFFCFLSSKASVRHSKVRFSFLKLFFHSSKTHEVRQALLLNIVPLPFVSCFDKRDSKPFFFFLINTLVFSRMQFGRSLDTRENQNFFSPSFCFQQRLKAKHFW